MYLGILGFLQKSYIRTIIIFCTIILIINLILIGTGHFDSEPAEGEEKFKRTTGNTITDSLYFTTTQVSSIGYGDITPKTTIAKWMCSFCHILIISISLKLISEFGIMSTTDKEIENTAILTENNNPSSRRASLHTIKRQSSNFSIVDGDLIKTSHLIKLRNNANKVVNINRVKNSDDNSINPSN